MRYVEKVTNIIGRSAQDNLLRTELRPDNIVGTRLAQRKTEQRSTANRLPPGRPRRQDRPPESRQQLPRLSLQHL